MSLVSDAQSLLQSLLAALGPSQHQRLLRLHTPLGENVLLAERFLGTETVGPRAPGQSPVAGFRFEVLALSTNAHLKLKDLMGQPVRLELLTAQGVADLRPFHGHVTAFALLGSDGGLARYKLTVEPWLAFLAHRQDAWVFQDKTVPQIVDEVFADYQGQGKLLPAWRWDLADAEAYPRRSLCVQYHESDLAFVQRLMAEEGLFCWFEHEAEEGEALGRHTLVIADHNGNFQPNRQPAVRYTQSAAAVFREDSLNGFDEARRVAPATLTASSWDHRAVQQPSAEGLGEARIAAEGLALAMRDQPGAYAYETAGQAERIVQRQLEALQAPAWRYEAQGALRQAACGTTFCLASHPSVAPDTRWVTLAVQHRGRNNISADTSTGLKALLGSLPAGFSTGGSEEGRAAKPSLFKSGANHTDEPLYQSRLLVQDVSLPVRAASCINAQGDIVFERPRVEGTQTAVVVGLGEPVHTDRDGRIKVQFHWQRGAQSALRLDHPAGSNAPGDDATGTWVRVMQAWAGANWGAHFTPRLGQEVLVAFIEGDADRPVVIGSAYNGQGSADAQGNQVAAGAGRATGNAGAWFPGNARAGELQGHQHPAVLTGLKSQSLESSQGGSGGYNQLVLDDSPGESRTLIGSTTAATWLQLGHLLRQNDNQRLTPRGHGLDLGTTAHGAVRAGAGLMFSAYARRQGTQSAGHSMEAREATAQLEQAGELLQTLADSAQKHQAKLQGEPEPKDLRVRKAQQASVDSLSATDTRSTTAPSEGGEIVAIQGGAGTTPAWTRPDLLIAAPGGVAAVTPAHQVMSAGATASLVAGQDLNLVSQRHTAVAVKSGLSLFTYGKAQNADKPNTETGLQLHAATGTVSVQAQANTLSLTADKSVAVSSVTQAITMAAPKHVLLTAGGASIRITTGAITLTTSGPAQFKAAMKELAGPQGASASLDMDKADALYDELFVLTDKGSGSPLASFKYRIEDSTGAVLARGITDELGRSQRVHTSKSTSLRIVADDFES